MARDVKGMSLLQAKKIVNRWDLRTSVAPASPPPCSLWHLAS